MKRYEELYHLLSDAEDLLQGGFRRGHLSLSERMDNLASVNSPASLPAGSPGGETRPRDPSNVQESEPAPERERLSPRRRRERLDALAASVLACTRCSLAMGRTTSVPGEGVLDPLVMVIGEGPGLEEDETGRPFVGAAGRYLDRWLAAVGLSRAANAYITNIVKCRPPNNRDPLPEETDACAPWLHEQIALVRPRLILTVGRISMRILTGTTQGITRIHGTFFAYRGIPLVPTFHPSAVLRREEWRRPVWEDLKTVRNWLVDNAGHVAPPDPPQ